MSVGPSIKRPSIPNALDELFARVEALERVPPLEFGSVFAGCRVHGTSASDQSIPNDALTPLEFAVEDFDSDGYHSGADNTKITIPTGLAGKYLLIANAIDVVAGGTTRGQRVLVLRKNGTTLIQPIDTWESYLGVTSTTDVNVLQIPLQVNHILDLNEGDYVQALWLSRRDGGPGADSIDSQFCNFAATWLGE